MEDAVWELGQIAATPVPDFPRLNPWITVVELDNGVVQLRSENFLLTISNELLARTFLKIQHLLDGEHNTDAVCAAAVDVDQSTAIFVLKILQAHAALTMGDNPLFDNRPLAGKLCIIGNGSLPERIANEMGAQLTNQPVVKHDLDELAIENLDSESLEKPDLIVAAYHFSSQAEFKALNQRCLAMNTRYLALALSMSHARLGPTVIPFQSACYNCMNTRLASSETDARAYRRYLETVRAEQGGDKLATRSLEACLLGHALPEITRLLTGAAPPQTIGGYFQYDIDSPGAQYHRVLKVPRCADCGRDHLFRDPWDRLD